MNVPRRKLATPGSPSPEVSAPEPTAPTENVTERIQAGRVKVEQQAEKFVALVQERPEVGLGVAFLGGLILASILKRLAR